MTPLKIYWNSFWATHYMFLLHTFLFIPEIYRILFLDCISPIIQLCSYCYTTWLSFPKKIECWGKEVVMIIKLGQKLAPTFCIQFTLLIPEQIMSLHYNNGYSNKLLLLWRKQFSPLGLFLKIFHHFSQ